MNIIGWAIIVCEILFWIVIMLGLIFRYLLKMKRLGLFFLALTPVVDFILIIVTSVDLYHGATATIAHGLAAVYIGVSLSFGKSMIKWADERFQYYIAKTITIKPQKKYGIQFAKQSAWGVLKHFIAWCIGSAILIIMIYYIDEASRTEVLSSIIKTWFFILMIDLCIAVYDFIWPRKEKEKV